MNSLNTQFNGAKRIKLKQRFENYLLICVAKTTQSLAVYCNTSNIYFNYVPTYQGLC